MLSGGSVWSVETGDLVYPAIESGVRKSVGNLAALR
jgi:hypothetical protein